MREKLNDVGCRGGSGSIGGCTPFFVERPFLNVLGLASDAKLMPLGSRTTQTIVTVSLLPFTELTRTVPWMS